MDARLAAALTSAVAILALPAAAHAASLSVSPVKPCYRSGEVIDMTGAGFTPNTSVSLSADGRRFDSTTADGAGTIGGRLEIGSATERVKTYTATEDANTANSASVPLRISPLSVNVAPRSGAPGRRLRISARGFTSGSRLYAHIVRGRRRANVRLGPLRGACRKLTIRRRLLPRRTAPGIYIVQFDTRPGYSRNTRVRVRFRVAVYRAFGSRASQAWMSG